MDRPLTFADRVHARLNQLSSAEKRVAHFLKENRAQVLITSAAMLAKSTNTSDATVLRTTKALGFSGMRELRYTLADELKNDLSPADRLVKTLSEIGGDLEAAFQVTLDIHQKSLESLRRDITPESFRMTVQHMVGARRVIAFGIGPSSALANYLTIQLGRFGNTALSMTQTGRLFADDLQKLNGGDLLIIFAYTRVYRELMVLLNEAKIRGIPSILITDSLGTTLREHVELVLTVARGKADMLSMHTATLGLIEALLVGVAATHPEETMTGLKRLRKSRNALDQDS